MLDALGEGRPLHQLHHQRVFFSAVNVRDVGMVQRRQHFGLALEAQHAVAGERKRVRQHLHRDLTFQPGVFGAIDFAHAAGAERRQDVVRP